MRRSRSLQVWGRALAELALPVSCPGCGAPEVSLCPDCARSLVAPARIVSPSAWSPALPVWAGPHYQGTVSRAIVAWKDRGRLDLTPFLAGCLAGTLAFALAAGSGGPRSEWRDGAGAPVLLVPAPSTAAATRHRGEDVVALLARAAADLLRARGDPVLPPLRVLPALRLRAGVADQAGLRAGQRRRNVSGRVRPALGCRSLLAGRQALLVDDVVTTGSTASAAVRALEGAGAIVLGACAICATPRGNLRGVAVSGAIQVV